MNPKSNLIKHTLLPCCSSISLLLRERTRGVPVCFQWRCRWRYRGREGACTRYWGWSQRRQFWRLRWRIEVWRRFIILILSGNDRDFIEIHNAYETLSYPMARAVYDMSLVSRRRTRTASFGCSGQSGFHPARKWETDQCW